MKASEMIAMLEKNPKLKFINGMKAICEYGTGFGLAYIMSQEWGLLKEVVPSWVAIKAWVEGKSVSYIMPNGMEFYLTDKVDLDTSALRKAKWYIGEEL